MDSRFFRGRRLRRTPALRDLMRETHLSPEDFILPFFVVEAAPPDFARPISAMPGQYQFGLERLVDEVDQAADQGVKAVLLFGIPASKDPTGSEACNPAGIVQRAVAGIKKRRPELVVITDVCLCEYTSHGHCGVIHEGDVLNDPTLELLARSALSHVRAGADIVAPSDMMDGRVAAIRQALDDAGFTATPILSYAVKYASSLYGPFREAAESTPQFGDRKSYQMDPANGREAMLEAAADEAEGADILMVKPAGAYLDIIRRLRESTDLPLCAYQVSGEYAMIKAAAQAGWIDETRVMLETLTAIKRAGADLIITYFALDAIRALRQ